MNVFIINTALTSPVKYTRKDRRPIRGVPQEPTVQATFSFEFYNSYIKVNVTKPNLIQFLHQENVGPGSSVVVTGILKFSNYRSDDGQYKTSYSITAQDLALDASIVTSVTNTRAGASASALVEPSQADLLGSLADVLEEPTPYVPTTAAASVRPREEEEEEVRPIRRRPVSINDAETHFLGEIRKVIARYFSDWVDSVDNLIPVDPPPCRGILALGRVAGPL